MGLSLYGLKKPHHLCFVNEFTVFKKVLMLQDILV